MTSDRGSDLHLLRPWECRGVRTKNRMVLAPMQVYTGKNGFPTEWHHHHLAKYALGGFGTQEIILILIVVVLLFGAKKLPELARGSGRALRIFKAETKGLLDDEDDAKKTEEQRQIAWVDRCRFHLDQHLIALRIGEIRFRDLDRQRPVGGEGGENLLAGGGHCPSP